MQGRKLHYVRTEKGQHYGRTETYNPYARV